MLIRTSLDERIDKTKVKEVIDRRIKNSDDLGNWVEFSLKGLKKELGL